MTTICVVRRGGVLMPATDEDRDAMRAIPAGVEHAFDFRPHRNHRLFRKWWALAKWAFDHWREDVAAVTTYRGQSVTRSFDSFRRDLIILAGFYNPVFGLDGSIRLEPRSISWARMDEEEFTTLYEATVDVVLRHLASSNLSRDELDAAIEEAMRFA